MPVQTSVYFCFEVMEKEMCPTITISGRLGTRHQEKKVIHLKNNKEVSVKS